MAKFTVQGFCYYQLVTKWFSNWLLNLLCFEKNIWSSHGYIIKFPSMNLDIRNKASFQLNDLLSLNVWDFWSNVDYCFRKGVYKHEFNEWVYTMLVLMSYFLTCVYLNIRFESYVSRIISFELWYWCKTFELLVLRSLKAQIDFKIMFILYIKLYVVNVHRVSRVWGFVNNLSIYHRVQAR